MGKDVVSITVHCASFERSLPLSGSCHDSRVLDHAELPGADLFDAGIEDLRSGVESPAALLVSMARERLLSAGFEVPQGAAPRPGHRLYDLLAAENAPAAHSRYNALVRRIVSFARAAEHAAAR